MYLVVYCFCQLELYINDDPMVRHFMKNNDKIRTKSGFLFFFISFHTLLLFVFNKGYMHLSSIDVLYQTLESNIFMSVISIYISGRLCNVL